jgi:Ca-activated chloride channel homolog
MLGYHFSKLKISDNKNPSFEKLFDLFKELLLYTAGDFTEALDWLNELDRKFKITDNSYGMGNFIEDLKSKGYIEDKKGDGSFEITPKTEQTIRKDSLDQIFGKLKKTKLGNHKTRFSGNGDEIQPETRAFEFGDAIDSISATDSIKNAQISGGVDNLNLSERDLVVFEKEYKTQTSTVLLIDISHSMILYGEDRITPAKKVAMALAELIKTKYPKDTLDIVTFGDDAEQITVKELPYLKVGPYHTNTVAGLEMAMEILRKRKNSNKQIFMITDGKPSCLKEAGGYYKNSFGLDRKIVNKTLNMAAACKRLGIPITTFMIAKDPYLQQFVEEFTETNNGKAFYTSLQGLGEYIFQDFERNKRKRTK